VLELTTTVWVGTLALIVGLFVLDLVVSARNPHAVGFKEAVAWSVFYVGVALAFGVWMYAYFGSEFGAQYFAGYIVEKSLSVDNLFVFVIIMTTFADLRHRDGIGPSCHLHCARCHFAESVLVHVRGVRRDPHLDRDQAVPAPK
jgi:hypothetical protein